MKGLLTSLLLVSLGASGWWLLSRTAQFSVKKWDAKFGSVLRHSLDQFGLSDTDVVSSVHEVRADTSGEWTVHFLRLKLADTKMRQELQNRLRSAGADVVQRAGRDPALLVRRNGRLYQEIQFVPR